MIIINQDRDQIYYNLSTKDIFSRRHFVFTHFRLIFMGWNMYARTPNGKSLLGTFDSERTCRKTIDKMRQLEKADSNLRYAIPEESGGIEGLEGAENV